MNEKENAQIENPSKKVGPPFGSKNAVKFKTDKEKKELFRAVIEHLKNGFDQKHFPLCDWDTVESYCKKYPEIFIPDEVAAAKRTGFLVVEKMLNRIALGGKGNPAAAIFIAKNKLGWRDKMQVSNDPDAPFKSAGVERDEIVADVAATFARLGIIAPSPDGPRLEENNTIVDTASRPTNTSS